MTANRFVVPPSRKGQTLQDALAEHLHLSRRQAKALLDERSVFVNRRRIWMARHELRAGDEIEIAGAADRPARTERTSGPRPPKVRFEDDHLLVLDKPPGLLSDGPDGAVARLAAARGLTGLEAVHRLDRDTSGALLVARTPQIRDALIQIFATRAVTKVYQAVVMGDARAHPPPEVIRKPVDGASAVTGVKVLRAGRQASLLELHPETGRTHQIRIHLQSVGLPVAGDRAYQAGRIDDPALRRIPRQMLHALHIGLAHPVTGKPLHVTAPLPPDFIHALRQLRLAPPPRRRASPGAARGGARPSRGRRRGDR